MKFQANTLLLASASPRRKEMLRLLGMPFVSRPAKLKETMQAHEPAPHYAGRMAQEKALRALQKRRSQDPIWILAADTVVYLPAKPNRVFGKPKSVKQARAFLQELSGKKHEVITAFCILNATDPVHHRLDRIVRTTVYFRKLHAVEISAYLATNEWCDKAGGYGIQGKAAMLIDTLEGSYSNVVGLPADEILEAVKTLCIPGWWNGNHVGS